LNASSSTGALRRLAAKPVYPWLLAIYPIASIAALNSGQFAQRSLVVAIAGAALAASVLVLSLRVALRGWHRAALAAGIAVALFYAFGPASTAIEAWWLGEDEFAGSAAAAHRISLILSAVWAVALVTAAVLVRRAREQRAAAFATPLNLLAALLLGITAAQGLTSGSALETSEDVATGTGADARSDESLPDVYYIILDGYARADVLEQYYGHDNSPFLAALRDRGFAVNEQSFSNYYWTFLSLASSLNMDYVPAVLDGKLNPDSVDRRTAYELIRNSSVSRVLRAHGYRFIQLQSTWGATLENPHADTLVPCGSTLFADEFLRTVAEASWLRVLTAQASGSLADCHRQNFASLASIAALPERKFVLAHFLLPHHPYLFDRNGNVLSNVSITNQFDFQSRLWEQRNGYLEQLLYVNDAVLAAIAEIQRQSTRPPIIVLQSDHGPQLNNGLVEAEQRRVRLANLAAFHLPDAPRDLIPQGDSPVNFFRRILDFYVGANLPPLENRHFYSTYRRPFAFKDVTELLHSDARPVVSAATE
jgi:hypothetical protein